MVDRDYVDQHTTGFAELEKFLADYAPERVAKITGLSQETIFKTALLYGRAKAGFIGWTMGVNHSTLGTATVNAICNLALLTGTYRPRGRFAVFDHGPVQCHGDARGQFRFELFLDIASSTTLKIDADLAAIWGIDEARAPDQARLGVSGHRRGCCG